MSLLKKVYERGAFSNKRYTKGVPFLKKMVYKRVRGASPYKTFLSTPPRDYYSIDEKPLKAKKIYN